MSSTISTKIARHARWPQQPKSNQRKGFTLSDGIASCCDRCAVHKYMTGVFDDMSRQNTKSYLEEIFEMCGMKFEGEKYILDRFEEYGGRWKLPKNNNIGCGGRWTTRLCPDEHWTRLVPFPISEYVFLQSNVVGNEH